MGFPGPYARFYAVGSCNLSSPGVSSKIGRFRRASAAREPPSPPRSPQGRDCGASLRPAFGAKLELRVAGETPALPSRSVCEPEAPRGAPLPPIAAVEAITHNVERGKPNVEVCHGKNEPLDRTRVVSERVPGGVGTFASSSRPSPKPGTGAVSRACPLSLGRSLYAGATAGRKPRVRATCRPSNPATRCRAARWE